MSNLAERLPDNAQGKYYVDANCIDCDQCRTTAPELFARNAETGFSSVLRQPLTAEELALAEEVLAACPTQSIGNDGV